SPTYYRNLSGVLLEPARALLRSLNMIPRYFQPMLLIDARLDREITGRIPSEFAFSSFEVAVHYVEPHQTHIKFLQPILNAFYITPLSYTQTRPDDFPAGSRGDSADG